MTSMELGRSAYGEFLAKSETERARLLDNLEKWLGATLMSQSAVTSYFEDAMDEVRTPEVREQLMGMHERALKHTRQVEDMYRAIRRDPPETKEAIGGFAAKGREFLANVEGLAAGASGAYADLQEVAVANFRAMGALGTTMRLGLALGLSDLPGIAFEIVNEKMTDQAELQKTLMDLAPEAILYNRPV